MKSEAALIVFAKNSEIGKVKTRLAKSVGDEEALAVYQKLLAWTQQESLRSSADCLVYYTSKIEHQDGWINADKRMQVQGDLGFKMATAIKEQLVSYKKVCIIGTDCAELTAEIIEEAFEHLDNHDFVVGPANDGGYYLLGMKEFRLALFEHMEWSTSTVLDQTISRIKEMEKTYFLLPELIDVDTLEDWNLVKEKFE